MITKINLVLYECSDCGYFWYAKDDKNISICPKCQNKVHEYIYTNIPKWDTNAIPLACRSCNNHPSNGGSGICHCILGNSTIY